MLAPVTIAAVALSGLCALAIASCTAELKPAPHMRVAGGMPVAFTEVEGIRVTVAPDQWSGDPANLGDVATLLHVDIANFGEHPFRIRYDHFKLTGRAFGATAIPPYNMEGTVIEPVFLPQAFVYPRGLELAPYYRTRPDDTSQPRHPWNYGESTPGYNLWASLLPTEDMLAKGVPEGTLEPGGRVSGFLYFDKVPEDLQRLTFEIDLVNASTGARFGTVRIPFLVN